MENKNFLEIIEYAIEKENEAIDFYTELKMNEKLPNVIKVLDDIINMEKGHINRLNMLRTSGPVSVEKIEMRSMNLSDYYEKQLSYENMDYISLLRIAMKREDQAKKLYLDLANYTTDTDIRNLFLLLSSEEDQHKALFEEIYQDYVLVNN